MIHDLVEADRAIRLRSRKHGKKKEPGKQKRSIHRQQPITKTAIA
jgi:hypothetical protein